MPSGPVVFRSSRQLICCSLCERHGAEEPGRSDPLEQVLYFTSVGVPSYVYDTVGGT